MKRATREVIKPAARAMPVGVLAALTVIATGVVLTLLVPRQMFPHDEGQYGQGALRVLAGELPHRDYHEMYTGGLSAWHAIVFFFTGPSSAALRYAMVFASLPAAWAMFDIVWRVTKRREVAALVTFASFVVSVGMMHAPWANLYLLFFTIAMLWALVRDAESPHWSWLVAAGVFAGMAIAVKVTGIFAVAAAGMALTYRGTGSREGVASPWEHMLHCSVAFVGVAAVVMLLRSTISFDAVLYFVLPVAGVAAALVVSGQRCEWKSLLLRYLSFTSGLTLAITVLVLPWLIAGAENDFIVGVFVRPQLRLNSAAFYAAPSAIYLPLAVAAVLAIFPAQQTRWQLIRWVGVAALVALAIQGLDDVPHSLFTSATMLAVLAPWRWLLSVLNPLLAFQLREVSAKQPILASQTFAIASVAAFFALNQFPFASPMYFFACFPLILLTAVAYSCLNSAMTSAEAFQLTDLPRLAAPCIFVIFCLARFGLDGMYGEYFLRTQDAPRVGVLSGIIVPENVSATYEAIDELLDSRLAVNETILAGPDCPEIYFFSGRRNVTPYVFDMFANDENYDGRLREFARREDIGAMVINRTPEFSQPWSSELCAELQRQCAEEISIGRFTILIKKSPGTITAQN